MVEAQQLLRDMRALLSMAARAQCLKWELATYQMAARMLLRVLAARLGMTQRMLAMYDELDAMARRAGNIVESYGLDASQFRGLSSRLSRARAN